MSEELNQTDVKKKNSKKRESTEQYQYIPEDNEQLIMDKPSESLNIVEVVEINVTEVAIKEEEKEEKEMTNPIKEEKKVILKSNKELCESYIKDLKKFSLSINGEIMYDSSIDKSNEYPIKFENDYFILYGKKYSYNGLKIQKIN